MAKYCQNCGKEIEDNAVFCGNCGASQTAGATAQPAVQAAPVGAVTTPTFVGILGMVLVLQDGSKIIISWSKIW